MMFYILSFIINYIYIDSYLNNNTMGNFLSSIEGKTVSVDSALLNSTHSKLI